LGNEKVNITKSKLSFEFVALSGVLRRPENKEQVE